MWTYSLPQLEINASHNSLTLASLSCCCLSACVSGLSNLMQAMRNSNLHLDIAARYKGQPVTVLHISAVERWLSFCCPVANSTPKSARISVASVKLLVALLFARFSQARAILAFVQVTINLIMLSEKKIECLVWRNDTLCLVAWPWSEAH